MEQNDIARMRNEVNNQISKEPDLFQSACSGDPVFPFEIISGIAREFTDLYGSYLEVPREFLYISFLTCLGSCVCTNLTLESEINPQPRLYTVLLGESADDRKSTALLKVTGFFKRFFPHKLNECWGVNSAEGLQKKIKEQEGLLLCFDEFKGFVVKCRVESSVLLPCVNTLFESNRYEAQTKKSSLEIHHGYLSILAASTIATYQNMWAAQFTDIGFNNRLFIVPGSSERKYPVPSKIPEEELNKISVQMDRLFRDLGCEKKELPLTRGGLQIYEEWYLAGRSSVHSKRLDTYAMRLMPLLAVNEGKVEVDEDIVRKILALCDWQLNVRQLYDPIDSDNAVARLEEAIRRQLQRGPKSERDLRNRTNAKRAGLWFFDAALHNLRKAGEIVLQRGNGKRKVWTIRAESNV